MAACADSCMTSPSLPVRISLPLAIHHGDFGGQDRAANFGPRQPGNQADFAPLVRFGVAELHYAQIIGDVFGGEGRPRACAFLDHLSRDLTADVTDLALQVADAGFARVVADDGW